MVKKIRSCRVVTDKEWSVVSSGELERSRRRKESGKAQEKEEESKERG